MDETGGAEPIEWHGSRMVTIVHDDMPFARLPVIILCVDNHKDAVLLRVIRQPGARVSINQPKTTAANFIEPS